MKTVGLGNPREGPSFWTCGPSKPEWRSQSPLHGGSRFPRTAGPVVTQFDFAGLLG